MSFISMPTPFWTLLVFPIEGDPIGSDHSLSVLEFQLIVTDAPMKPVLNEIFCVSAEFIVGQHIGSQLLPVLIYLRKMIRNVVVCPTKLKTDEMIIFAFNSVVARNAIRRERIKRDPFARMSHFRRQSCANDLLRRPFVQRSRRALRIGEGVPNYATRGLRARRRIVPIVFAMSIVKYDPKYDYRNTDDRKKDSNTS